MRLIFPSFLFASLAVAAPADAEPTEAQLWTAATAEVGLTDDLDFSFDLVARASDAAEGIYQTQIGSDLTLDVGSGVKVAIGYSHVPSYEDGRVATRENRIRQQVAFPIGSAAGGKLTGRLRLEQRWRDDGDDLKLRLRPRIMWHRPIGPDGLAVRVAHESFYNLNDTDWGAESRYDRMRNSIALRRRLTPVITGEVGYLNQYIFAGDRPDEIDHALTLAATVRF